MLLKPKILIYKFNQLNYLYSHFVRINSNSYLLECGKRTGAKMLLLPIGVKKIKLKRKILCMIFLFKICLHKVTYVITHTQSTDFYHYIFCHVVFKEMNPVLFVPAMFFLSQHKQFPLYHCLFLNFLHRTYLLVFLFIMYCSLYSSSGAQKVLNKSLLN